MGGGGSAKIELNCTRGKGVIQNSMYFLRDQRSIGKSYFFLQKIPAFYQSRGGERLCTAFVDWPCEAPMKRHATKVQGGAKKPVHTIWMFPKSLSQL